MKIGVWESWIGGIPFHYGTGFGFSSVLTFIH